MTTISSVFADIAKNQGAKLFEELDQHLDKGGAADDYKVQFTAAITKELVGKSESNPDALKEIAPLTQVDLPKALEKMQSDPEGRKSIIQGLKIHAT